MGRSGLATALLKILQRLSLALVIMLSVIWLFLKLPQPDQFLVDPDGGGQVAGAQQIQFGEHPFVDWRSTYGPAVYYTSYIFRVLFGSRLISDFALCMLGYVLAYTLLYLCIWRLTGRLLLALPLVLVGLFHLPRYYKYYVLLGPLLVLLLLYRYVERPGRGRIIAVAGAVSLTGLYRPDFGVYTLFLAAVGIVLSHGRDHRATLRHLRTFALSVVVFAAPWLMFLLTRGRLDAYLWDSSFGAFRHVEGMALPIPRIDFGQPLASPPNRTAVAFAIWYLVPAMSVALLSLRWSRLEPLYRTQATVTIIAATLCLLQSVHRADYGHLIQSISCAYIALAFLMNV